MKNTCKLFMLGLMLLGVAGVNCKDNPSKVNAEETEPSGTYVTFNEGQLKIGDVYPNNFRKLTITNDESKLEGNGDLVREPFEIEYDKTKSTEGCNLMAYLYTNTESEYFYDCIIYTNADTIYANNPLVEFDECGNPHSIGMFLGYSGLKELDISELNTSIVTDMSNMFRYCHELTTLDLSNFNTSNVTNMQEMFLQCNALTELDLSSFNTKNVTNMLGMFSQCSNLTELDLASFNTSHVTNMSYMFCDCTSLTELNLSSFNTSNVTDMSFMFSCTSLITLDLSNFNTTNVTNMSNMFSACENLTTLDVSHFNTSNVTDMSEMFCQSYFLTELDVSKFDTSNVTNMSGMFLSVCFNLTTLDLSNFDMSNVVDSSDMISGCASLQQIKTPKNLGDNIIVLPDIELPEKSMFWDYNHGEILDVISSNMTNVLLVTSVSEDLQALITELNGMDTCKDYDKVQSIKDKYDVLNDTDKEVFDSWMDEKGVRLTDKIDYMEYIKTLPPEKRPEGNSLIKTLENNNYDIITITVLTLTSFIGIAGYYLIQKRKNIKA